MKLGRKMHFVCACILFNVKHDDKLRLIRTNRVYQSVTCKSLLKDTQRSQVALEGGNKAGLRYVVMAFRWKCFKHFMTSNDA